jgi:hypothetical protein
MKRSLLALALALSVIPTSALAQESNAPPKPTAEQRQQMRQTMRQFMTQEMQLRQQMRGQILATFTPVQRRAVAATIGDLAVEPSPDPVAAAKRLDAILSPGEQQRIVAAHSTFQTQSRQLHEQMRSQMKSMMPAGGPGMMGHGPMDGAARPRRQLDAGTVVLMALVPHPMMGMMGHGGFGSMMHGMDGPPPPAAP